jgi:membrane fusion protein, copper/silver efflux system
MTNTMKSVSAGNAFASRSGRRRDVVVMGALLVAALLIVIAFTTLSRNSNDATTSASHTHGAAKTTQVTTPVMISAEAAQRIGVTFAPVTLGPIVREIRTVAQVTFDETRVKIISAKVDGWVEQLYVNFNGQPVSAGQALLSVYSPMLVSAQEELILASKLSRSLADASSEARSGSNDLSSAARRRLLYWDISAADIERVERTGEVRKNLTLRSPVNGVVIEKNVLSGQKIMAGEGLYKVADLSDVWLEGEVFERDLHAVRVGTSVKAEFDALPGEARTGRVSYVYPTLNSETRTGRIRVTLRNPGMRLKPGMYATIRIEGAAEDGISVPRSAVLSTGERTMVFVRRADGMLQPRDVRIGESTEDRTRIISGVNVGETVVASATFLVDAESNLGSSLGGMGDMPGMDITRPSSKKE